MHMQPLSCLAPGKNGPEGRTQRAELETHSHPSAMFSVVTRENSHGNTKVTTNISLSERFSLPLMILSNEESNVS